MSRFHHLALASMAALALAAAPYLSAAPATFGELVDLVITQAASRSLDWSVIELSGERDKPVSVTLKARARLHQFAGVLALATGPAELGRDEDLRTCTLEVQLDAPPPPGQVDVAVAAILADLAARPGSSATLVLAPRTEGFTDVSVNATLPATTAGTPSPPLGELGTRGSVRSMTLTRRPDGTLLIEVRTSLPLPAPVAGAPASPPPPDWTMTPTEGGTALRLAVPPMARPGAGAVAAHVVKRFAERVRLLSVALHPDGATLSASLAPDSGAVQGP